MTEQHDQTGLIDRQIMWNRLISVVEEQAMTLQRTAFSSIVRESGDLSAGVFDLAGRMLAQAVTGTPGHVNSMALAVGHMLARHPAQTLAPGDVLITNDPWLGTGHTYDFTVVTPFFYRGRLSAFFACTSHIMDIGGVYQFTDSADVFMEGLYIPILKLVEAGRVNRTLMAMIRANTRNPVDTEGDTYSLIACNEVGCRRLERMMDEFGLEDLESLSSHILETSRNAVLTEIRRLPKGTWNHVLTLDGYEAPIHLQASLTVSDRGIHVDFTGSSATVRRNINVPLCYTLAYTCFGLACIVSRNIPNNAGSLAPFTISAPEGSIVNAQKPAPVACRHIVGLMLPDLVFGCLRQTIPERVPAESAGVLWGLNVRGYRSPRQIPGDEFTAGVVTTGGMGALPSRDGLSATGFPSGVRGGSIEIFETQSPVIVWRKEFRRDSGGAGRTRGGLGQTIELENGIDQPFLFNASVERVRFPAKGFAGGRDGAAGRLTLRSGEKLAGKGLHVIPAGDRLLIRSPGGGGLGEPKERNRDAVREDLREGLISPDAAKDIYGLMD
ncbi:hydantoinase B/oxoprolinase family protein [Telmatospirillum siberiense]|uniref:5-oxoprolinase n=1 Tax=Telmatospirillum siberiense TaxID=382514 RepID=A0A2N3PQ28_9PROT|nr:hydantoinase B/oxoprolinase family protein [Telmatospirillum siberiense]PKU22497.1 5-oxoprolinase [Telmatospirillum siberiense]